MNFMLKLCAVLALTILSACASSEISKPVEFFGGSKAGGFDAQTGCGAVMNGAGCLIATKNANGRIDLQQVALKDSVQGKITETVTTVGISKTADYLIGRDLHRRAVDNCGTGGCGTGGGQQITQVSVNTSSSATADIVKATPAPCTTCGSRRSGAVALPSL
jgi:hypothetical protein